MFSQLMTWWRSAPIRRHAKRAVLVAGGAQLHGAHCRRGRRRYRSVELADVIWAVRHPLRTGPEGIDIVAQR